MSILNPVVWMTVWVVFHWCVCNTELVLLYVSLQCLFLPYCFLPLPVFWPFLNTILFLYHTHTVLLCFFNSTHLFIPPHPPFFTSMPPLLAYISVDGDLLRPWLMLAQPPPPLCSLWWWGSLCCDTDAGSAGWNRLTWVVNLGKGRGQKGW